LKVCKYQNNLFLVVVVFEDEKCHFKNQNGKHYPIFVVDDEE